MRVGIDASNIRAGGGITHLAGILCAAALDEHGIAEIDVWTGQQTANALPCRDGVRLVHEPLLDHGLPQRAWWQRSRLPALLENVDVLLVPGGLYLGQFQPFVSMAQNLLPFDRVESARYGLSPTRARLALLRHLQLRTFRRSAGVIFPSRQIRDRVQACLGAPLSKTRVIHHGLDRRFLAPPRPQRPVAAYSMEHPFRLLYVSIVDVYKHQWRVVEAVAALRAEGLPVALDLVGPSYPASLKKLREALQTHDPRGAFARYVGSVPFSALPERYQGADAFVFASTCESFGQIVLEAMAAGLPIACSNRATMMEVLGDGGVYFDPLRTTDITNTLRRLISDDRLRLQLASNAHRRATTFSWERCAQETFAFIQESVARASRFKQDPLHV